MGSLYDSLTPKQRRVVRHHLDLIFSSKGITFPRSIEEMRSHMSAVGFIPPEFEYKDKHVLFSKEGVTSIREISSLIEGTRFHRDEINYNDIYQAVRKEIERWWNQELIPDESEFLGPLEHVICGKIIDRGFFCRVEGMTLDGVDGIMIGSKVIKRFDSKDIEKLVFADERLYDVISREYGNSTIIKGHQTGTDAAAQAAFYHTSELCLSVLRLYACVLYEWAISAVRIRLVNTCLGSYGNASSVGWAINDKNVVFTRYFRPGDQLVLNKAQLDHLKTHCFFTQLGSLIEKCDRNELEQAIVRSVYWFGEAEKDQEKVGKWLKLWSCVEAFFSSGGESITESNARGVAALLVFGGYALEESHNYASLKSKMKRFYVLRSRAIHRGEYQHIDDVTLQEFSYITAWIVIVMVSLSAKGYTRLAQVKAETNRLDAVCTKEATMKCKVYQSTKCPCIFFITPSTTVVSDLPAAVSHDIGTAAAWKEIDLHRGRRFIGLIPEEAIKNIESRGYHRQEVSFLFEEEA